MTRRALMVFVLAMVAGGGMRVAAQQDAPPAAADSAANAPNAQTPARRQLEQQLRLRLGEVVRRQLQLTDQQYAQLQAVNKKYEAPRRDLNQRERYLRLSLRAELQLGDKADQAKVGGYLDQMNEIQQSRLQIFRDEQRDLSGFLTPVQRAKYAALQEQLRKRLTQMRQRQFERQQARAGRVTPRPPR
ncbi:MAG TPA: Spy/CpxP family protein refolding chaperone [Gemmatimonadaceae bacterium]|nr:Spy/CpxP family protein refolding chaperone [Gemmatimonadaceae bacterium]